MLTIKIHSWFIQADTNASLQFRIRLQLEEGINPELVKKYTKLLSCADKFLLNTDLSYNETLFCARYFQSLKNELAGRTVRHLINL